MLGKIKICNFTKNGNILCMENKNIKLNECIFGLTLNLQRF